jgi:hypothetical protein
MSKEDTMREEQSTQEIGRQLGFEGVEHAVTNGERFSDYERQRIELTNRAPIIALKASIALLSQRELALQDKLRKAPPSGDLRARQRKAIYYWAVTYCHFDGLHALGLYDGSLFGMLGMDISHVNSAHIVAVDELGTVEPSDDVTTYH